MVSLQEGKCMNVLVKIACMQYSPQMSQYFAMSDLNALSQPNPQCRIVDNLEKQRILFTGLSFWETVWDKILLGLVHIMFSPQSQYSILLCEACL